MLANDLLRSAVSKKYHRALLDGRAVLVSAQPAEPAGELDLFPVVWPHLASQLLAARSEQDLAGLFHVAAPQMRQWLLRALEQRLIEKVMDKKKVTYRLLAAEPSPSVAGPGEVRQMSLFGN